MDVKCHALKTGIPSPVLQAISLSISSGCLAKIDSGKSFFTPGLVTKHVKMHFILISNWRLIAQDCPEIFCTHASKNVKITTLNRNRNYFNNVIWHANDLWVSIFWSSFMFLSLIFKNKLIISVFWTTEISEKNLSAAF